MCANRLCVGRSLTTCRGNGDGDTVNPLRGNRRAYSQKQAAGSRCLVVSVTTSLPSAAMKTVIAIAIAGLTFFASLTTLQFDSEGTIEVSGSSNVRDWSCTSTQLAGTMEAQVDGQRFSSIEGVTVSVPVYSLDCGPRGLTSKVRETLVGESNLVQFTLESAEVTGDDVVARGTLRAANGSRPTEIVAKATPADNGRIRLSGELELKMSELDIERPTAMLGALRADDEVRVKFDVTVHP